MCSLFLGLKNIMSISLSSHSMTTSLPNTIEALASTSICIFEEILQGDYQGAFRTIPKAEKVGT